jgi:putative ABC transport system permease protein
MSWLSGLFGRWKRERELADEVRSHLEMAARERTERGATEKEARHAARREFGNVRLVKEVTRDMWRGMWLGDLWQDLRYGFRMVRRNPGFAALAILTLMLGIGANTAIFSVVNGVLLRPLPYTQSDRLVAMNYYYPMGPYVIMRDQSRTMEIAANTESSEFNLTGVESPVRLTGTAVSGNWFNILGAKPEMGRTIQEGEDQPGKDQFVLLSHSLWERRFGGDRNIVGRWIILEGMSRQVIGVMPADFRYPSPKTDLWVPLNLDPRKIGVYWGDSYMPIVARLRQGATLEQARAEIPPMRTKVLSAYPWRMPDNMWKASTVLPMQELLVGDVRTKLLVLLGAVGLLLLIACANVANLLLARAITRQKEVAVRTALGAGKWRLTRQLMTESVLLTIIGGTLGFLAATYGLPILKATLPADLPRLADVTVDNRVLAFTALLAGVTGIVFGLLPMATATKVDLAKAMKSGGERSGTSGSHRLSNALIVVEVAVSVVLVIGAGLLAKSLWNLSTLNPGFQKEFTLTARITPNESFCEMPGRCQAFYEELLNRVRALPGVEAVGAVNGLPVGGGAEVVPSHVEAHPTEPGAHTPMFWEKVVTADYLNIMRIPVLRGRGFTESDSAPSAQRVVLVSKSLAERYWPGKDPIGEHIKPAWMNQWWTVVGVVGDVRENDIATDTANWIDGVTYMPYGPHAVRSRGPEAAPAEMTLVMRTSDDRLELGGELQSVVSQLNPEVPVSRVETMAGWIAEAVSGPRSTASLFSLFAGLALLLGAVGIYGVISYSVAQRTREIGIRIALGARRHEVLMMILRQGARLALAGVVTGLLGALLLTQLMASLLYGVGARDPLTYAAVAILLVLVALAASYLPARRATRVDPVIALRYE